MDASAELLARFEQDVAAEPGEVRAKVRVQRGLIEDYPERAAASRFEAVLCHGVLMYAADPGPMLRALALLDCEEQAGRSDPYRRVAALLPVVAKRS